MIHELDCPWSLSEGPHYSHKSREKRTQDTGSNRTLNIGKKQRKVPVARRGEVLDGIHVPDTETSNDLSLETSNYH